MRTYAKICLNIVAICQIRVNIHQIWSNKRKCPKYCRDMAKYAKYASKISKYAQIQVNMLNMTVYASKTSFLQK